MNIYGLDFTSVPSHKKPITCAQCRMDGDGLYLESTGTLTSFEAFDAFLARPGPWTAGLDFPFGQPRKLVENIGWPNTWEGYVRHVAEMNKDEFVDLLKHYRSCRPKGDKQHLRCTDALAGSRSPMMLFGVPVGKMFFEGAYRLLKSGASILPCHPQDGSRIVVEAYPGLAARYWIGNRSYKTDTKSKQTPARQVARSDMIRGLRSAATREYYGFAIQIDDRWADEFIQDGSGDKLDALLCAVQGGWAYSQRDQDFGIPVDCDRLEGWIIDPGLAPE